MKRYIKKAMSMLRNAELVPGPKGADKMGISKAMGDEYVEKLTKLDKAREAQWGPEFPGKMTQEEKMDILDKAREAAWGPEFPNGMPGKNRGKKVIDQIAGNAANATQTGKGILAQLDELSEAIAQKANAERAKRAKAKRKRKKR